MNPPLVRPYDPVWPSWFAEIRDRLGPALAGVDHRIEHVGSTSIPGMTAKPIIDLDIVVDRADLAEVRERLGGIGYFHQGDLGIPGREAFDLAAGSDRDSLPRHNPYVCFPDGPELRKHLAFREFLRAHPAWVAKLSAHKVRLCELHNNDREQYIAGKADMVREITDLALRWCAMRSDP
jgi:GrpB-like predicted nucleotidyltransferase (UPF0157 family)